MAERIHRSYPAMINIPHPSPAAGASIFCPNNTPNLASLAYRIYLQKCVNCRLTVIVTIQTPPRARRSYCCKSPSHRDTEPVRLYQKMIRCWACNYEFKYRFREYENPVAACKSCRHPYDGSQVVLWKDIITGEEQGYLDMDEVKSKVKIENMETRRSGKMCEHCGKRFGNRGFKNHENKCGSGKTRGGLGHVLEERGLD